jgi:hypothetical protein
LNNNNNNALIFQSHEPVPLNEMLHNIILFTLILIQFVDLKKFQTRKQKVLCTVFTVDKDTLLQGGAPDHQLVYFFWEKE